MIDNAFVIGVRLRSSPQVLFFTVDDLSLETGTWVEVPTPGGLELASIVIAPGQMALYEPVGYLAPVSRVLTVGEVEKMASERTAIAFQGTEPGTTERCRLIGGLGYPQERESAGSVEDDRYRQEKAGLPLPGEDVQTADGDGYVVGLDVFRKLVTIRYHDPERDVTIPASDVVRGSE